MRSRTGSLSSSKYIPLLSLIPIATLAFLSWYAFTEYSRGIENARFYGRNLCGPWLIGGILWAIVGGVLTVMLVAEFLLRKLGKGYRLPPVALVVVGVVNLLVGAVGFSSGDVLGCRFACQVMPAYIMPDAMAFTFITVGLLLFGIKCVKFESLEDELGGLAGVLTSVNGFLALVAAYLFPFMVCIAVYGAG